jgi:hypothetical protein
MSSLTQIAAQIKDRVSGICESRLYFSSLLLFLTFLRPAGISLVEKPDRHRHRRPLDRTTMFSNRPGFESRLAAGMMQFNGGII